MTNLVITLILSHPSICASAQEFIQLSDYTGTSNRLPLLHRGKNNQYLESQRRVSLLQKKQGVGGGQRRKRWGKRKANTQSTPANFPRRGGFTSSQHVGLYSVWSVLAQCHAVIVVESERMAVRSGRERGRCMVVCFEVWEFV